MHSLYEINRSIGPTKLTIQFLGVAKHNILAIET